MNYFCGILNNYKQTNSPLNIAVGRYNEKTDGYKCITKLENKNFKIINLSKNNIITKIPNYNAIMSDKAGSYFVLIYDVTTTENNLKPTLLPVYIFNELFNNTQTSVYKTITHELPQLYKYSNKYNNVDNLATAKVIEEVYLFIYNLFYNTVSSVGRGKVYNQNWEIVYFATNNLLKNFVYPADLIESLLQINGLVATKVKDIAIFLSRILYQMVGVLVPVYIYYNKNSKQYIITIYNTNLLSAWSLGDRDKSILGETTILTSRTESQHLWIISILARRLMPCSNKFTIIFNSIEIFKEKFNTEIVKENDYIDDNVIYDAYGVVNNDNLFNTKGYNLL